MSDNQAQLAQNVKYSFFCGLPITRAATIVAIYYGVTLGWAWPTIFLYPFSYSGGLITKTLVTIVNGWHCLCIALYIIALWKKKSLYVWPMRINFFLFTYFTVIILLFLILFSFTILGLAAYHLSLPVEQQNASIRHMLNVSQENEVISPSHKEFTVWVGFIFGSAMLVLLGTIGGMSFLSYIVYSVVTRYQLYLKAKESSYGKKLEDDLKCFDYGEHVRNNALILAACNMLMLMFLWFTAILAIVAIGITDSFTLFLNIHAVWFTINELMFILSIHRRNSKFAWPIQLYYTFGWAISAIVFLASGFLCIFLAVAMLYRSRINYEDKVDDILYNDERAKENQLITQTFAISVLYMFISIVVFVTSYSCYSIIVKFKKYHNERRL